MKITEVQIVPIKPQDGLVAFASLVINNEIYLGSIGIHTKLHGGYRITYPNKKIGNHSLDIFHPINAKVSKIIEEAILKAFEAIIK